MSAKGFNGTPWFIMSHLMPAFRSWQLVRQGWYLGYPNHLLLSFAQKAGFSTSLVSSDDSIILVTPTPADSGKFRLDALRVGHAVLTLVVDSLVVGPFIRLEMRVDVDVIDTLPVIL